MCYNERDRLYNLPLRRQGQRKRSLNRRDRLERGIMNAIDYVGIAKRKRPLNRRDRPERGIMNAVDYIICR